MADPVYLLIRNGVTHVYGFLIAIAFSCQVLRPRIARYREEMIFVYYRFGVELVWSPVTTENCKIEQIRKAYQKLTLKVMINNYKNGISIKKKQKINLEFYIILNITYYCLLFWVPHCKQISKIYVFLIHKNKI